MYRTPAPRNQPCPRFTLALWVQIACEARYRWCGCKVQVKLKFIYVNFTHKKQKKEQLGDNIAAAQASWPYFPNEFPLCILFSFLIHGSQHFLTQNKIILSTVYSYIYNAVSIELSTSGLLTRVRANLL